MKATIAIIFLLYVAACCLSGCITTEKATDHLKKKGKLAEVCLREYPLKDTTVYLPGDTVVEVIEVPGDTLLHFDTIWRNQYGVRVDTVRLKCPPTKTVIKTIVDTLATKRTDTREVDYWKRLFNKSQSDLEESKAQAKKWKEKFEAKKQQANYLWAFLIALLLGAGAIWWAKRK